MEGETVEAETSVEEIKHEVGIETRL